MPAEQPLRSVRLDEREGVLVLIDQTRLPNDTVLLRLSSAQDIREAIYSLRVRGAPAIGIAAAYGAYLAVRKSSARDWESLAREFRAAKELLASARPTAVNLSWALERMERRLTALRDRSCEEIKSALLVEAEAIRAEDEEACRTIGENGLSLLSPGWGILTHCNAGWLATSWYGTALAPLYLGRERGYGFRVYADETRPLLQGARLTAWELDQAGIDVTLICDNMACAVMKRGLVQAVLVGCDRVAANGDAANKIGTAGLAVLARYYRIPFYVLGPVSTIDRSGPSGAEIPVEERPPQEVTEGWYAHRMAPRGIRVLNPAFDVTDASLITAIVTERGIVRPPYGESLPRMLAPSRFPD